VRVRACVCARTHACMAYVCKRVCTLACLHTRLCPFIAPMAVTLGVGRCFNRTCSHALHLKARLAWQTHRCAWALLASSICCKRELECCCCCSCSHAHCACFFSCFFFWRTDGSRQPCARAAPGQEVGLLGDEWDEKV